MPNRNSKGVAYNRGDLTGKKFGKLEVVRFSHKNERHELFWLCRCLCGTEKTMRGNSIKSGRCVSCGCERKERARKANTVHGHTAGYKGTGKRSAEYGVWIKMKRRCFDDKCPDYPDYGGRGITVCERWLVFSNFLSDMGLRPSPEYSIDRFPDQAGDYKPGNCRWATAKQQARNRKSNRLITYSGKTKCLTEWAEYFSVCESVLRWRIKKHGESEAMIYFETKRAT